MRESEIERRGWKTGAQGERRMKRAERIVENGEVLRGEGILYGLS